MVLSSSKCFLVLSLPVRGAWIEIIRSLSQFASTFRRSPCGERGLKCGRPGNMLLLVLLLPVRGAWIEIFCVPP